MISSNTQLKKKLSISTYNGTTFFTIALEIFASSLLENNVKLDTVSIPVPSKKWKPAKKGVLEEFSGILIKLIPELSDVSDEEIEEALSRKLE